MVRPRVSLAVVFVVSCVACKGEEPRAGGAPSASAPAPSAAVPAEPPPAGCKASGGKPVALATVTGDVHGFAGDATHLYYSGWEIYGSRGDVGQIRKDGGGAKKLSSLALDPRALALGDAAVYYTAGIRLMAVPKEGGDDKEVVPIFSSQSIALLGSDVFGVPGDYGPYDRLAKVATKGGEPEELATGKRPARKEGPNGWSRVAADASGVYVTDTGGDRVIAFPLPKGKFRPIASRLDRPFDLAIAGENLVFSLAKKGELWLVPKAGGATKKLGSGLVPDAHIAVDGNAVYGAVAGENEDDALRLARIPLDGGPPKELAQVPSSQGVRAIAADGTCVYWAQRESGTKSVVYALSL